MIAGIGERMTKGLTVMGNQGGRTTGAQILCMDWWLNPYLFEHGQFESGLYAAYLVSDKVCGVTARCRSQPLATARSRSLPLAAARSRSQPLVAARAARSRSQPIAAARSRSQPLAAARSRSQPLAAARGHAPSVG